MTALSQVGAGVWKWDGVDADHGFPITGYIVPGEGGVLLVDPPGTSGSLEEIKACGEARAILVTSRWHVRGAGKWKDLLQVPIAAPASAAGELAEARTRAERTLAEGDEFHGWRVLELEAGGGKYTEAAYWHAPSATLIVGDLLTALEGGSLAFGPHLFSQVPNEDLRPCVDRLVALKPQRLLSAHIGVRNDAASALLEPLK